MVVIGVFFLDRPEVRLVEGAGLDQLEELGGVVHPFGFSEHVAHLLDGHMDAVFFEQSADLTAVEGAASIMVELLEHVVDDGI